MTLDVKVTGVDGVLGAMEKAKEEFGKRFERGAIKAGLFLQRESQKKVPVDYGILKASAFTRKEGEGFNARVRVGYTAFYALFVHELVQMKLKGKPRPGGRGFFWDPQGQAQAKFLEEPSRRLIPEMRSIILKEMGIPPGGAK